MVQNHLCGANHLPRQSTGTGARVSFITPCFPRSDAIQPAQGTLTGWETRQASRGP